MIGKQGERKVYGRKNLWCTLMYYPSNCPEGLGELMKILRQDKMCPIQDCS
jgi:hypothetical protein